MMAKPLNGAHHIDFYDDRGKQNITGTGEAHEVFGHVLKALGALMKQKQLPAVKFVSVEKSRGRLYERIARTLAAAVPGYTASVIDSGKIISGSTRKSFTLKRGSP